MRKPSSRLSPYERVFLGIAVVVTTVWAVATVVQIISPTHIVPEYANLVMMAVAGAFFGGAVLSSRSFARHVSNDEDDPYHGPGGYYKQ